MRIYLSGPMSGLTDPSPAFHAYAAQLRAAGHEVVNPADLNPEPGKTWHDCLRTDIRELCGCDALALLPGWERSAGANLELHLAHRLGMEVIPLVAQFDLVLHLRRQHAFSERTFGPGGRVAGICDHILRELIEVLDSGGALAEWVDVINLGLDGAWRSGATPEQICEAIAAKQLRNEGRSWPDWRSAEPGKAIEHIREATS